MLNTWAPFPTGRYTNDYATSASLRDATRTLSTSQGKSLSTSA
ncbi:MAG: hypothetical protein V7K54_03590 [Nostoc sp.]